MATLVDIQDFIAYLRTLPRGFERSRGKALQQTSVLARNESLKNARGQFIGRNGRRLSGTLLNSIFSSIENEGTKPVGFVVGVRNIPYGAIHEFGGKIEPVKAKKLWIPQYKFAGKMTPREFIRSKRQQPGLFFLNDEVAGKWENPESKARTLVPLFFLVDEVRIPERPYLRPAIEVATERFPAFLDTALREET